MMTLKCILVSRLQCTVTNIISLDIYNKPLSYRTPIVNEKNIVINDLYKLSVWIFSNKDNKNPIQTHINNKIVIHIIEKARFRVDLTQWF